MEMDGKRAGSSNPLLWNFNPIYEQRNFARLRSLIPNCLKFIF